jgi:intracellular sulfur oxidation DsrE/DsrF family protein
MKNFKLILSFLIIAAAMTFIALPIVNAHAVKYGPSSYSSYPAYYNTHPLPTSKYFKHKILKMVMEVDSPNPAKWNYAVGVLTAVMKAFGDNPSKFKIELVAFGAGVKMVNSKTDKTNAARLQSLTAYGLKIRACHNAMLAFHLTKKDLFPFVKVVPAGAIEIIRKIDQGYAPLKP